MSHIPTLFPLTITSIKNKFLMHVILRNSTRDVNNIIDRYRDVIQTPHGVYLYLRDLQFHNRIEEITIFENAYEEFIMYEIS
jgi:hypothetical protein